MFYLFKCTEYLYPGSDFTLEVVRHIINYPKLEIYSLTFSTQEDPIFLTEF